MQRKGSKSAARWVHLLLLCALLGGLGALPPGAGAAVRDGDSYCASPLACTFAGIANVALGEATLSLNSSGHLIVSGIGSTGQDGVSQVSLPPRTGEVVTEFAGSNFGTSSQPGAMESVTVHADVPGGIYYRLDVENLGKGVIEARPDFSPVGATRYTLTVLNGNTVTGVFANLPSARFQTGECVQVEFN